MISTPEDPERIPHHAIETVSAFAARAGADGGQFASEWLTVGQARIDGFAKVAEDRQFIHVDPVRAASGPFGTTIAHGFLTLSLLAPLSVQALPRLSDQVASVNYGFDRIRMISPVPSESRIRGIFALAAADRRPGDSMMLRYHVTVEIEGSEKPALVADWLVLIQAAQDAAGK